MPIAQSIFAAGRGNAWTPPQKALAGDAVAGATAAANLSVTADGDPGQLVTMLTWNASAGATSYKVYRGTSPGSYSNSWNVGNVTEYDVNLLTPKMVFDTTYHFAVAAIDGGGEGAKSTEIQVRDWVKL